MCFSSSPGLTVYVLGRGVGEGAGVAVGFGVTVGAASVGGAWACTRGGRFTYNSPLDIAKNCGPATEVPANCQMLIAATASGTSNATLRMYRSAATRKRRK